MLKKLIKNKKAQNTAEYAILISLVVAGIIAMQTYAQRTLQGRVRDASKYLNTQSSALGNTVQYEPYYVDTNYNVDSATDTTRLLGNNLDARRQDDARTRRSGGYSNTKFCATGFGLPSDND